MIPNGLGACFPAPHLATCPAPPPAAGAASPARTAAALVRELARLGVTGVYTASCHTPRLSGHTGHPRLLLQRARQGTTMTAHDTTATLTVTPDRPARRADAGTIRLSQRDIA